MTTPTLWKSLHHISPTKTSLTSQEMCFCSNSNFYLQNWIGILGAENQISVLLLRGLFLKVFIFFALSCADFLSLDLSWKLLGGRDCVPYLLFLPSPYVPLSSSYPDCSSAQHISQANVGCLTIVLGTKVSSPQSKHVDSSTLASAFHHSLLAPVLCNQFLQKSLWNWELPPVLSV